MFSTNPRTLVNPLILYSTNAMVEETNKEVLRNLKGKRFIYMGKLGEYKGTQKFRPSTSADEYFKDLPCLLETMLCEGNNI